MGYAQPPLTDHFPPADAWNPVRALSMTRALRHDTKHREYAPPEKPWVLFQMHPRHFVEEERYVLLGFSRRQRLLAVMFTERAHAIRIISARRATQRERRDYEEKRT